MVALSNVARFPELIREIFLVDTLNINNVYAVTLYMLGIPVTVSVDGYLPVDADY